MFVPNLNPSPLPPSCVLQAMATPAQVHPFSPEEARRIVGHLQQPAVFLNMTCDWPVLHWTAEHLSACLGDRLIRFRLGRKEETNSKNTRFILTHLVWNNLAVIPHQVWMYKTKPDSCDLILTAYVVF